MEQKILKKLLNKKFFQAYGSKLKRYMFPEEILDVYDAIVNTQTKFEHDVTLNEIKALFRAANPTITQARWMVLDHLFDSIEAEEEIHDEVALELINKLWAREHARKVADQAVSIVDGRSDSFNTIIELATEAQEGKPDEEQPEVTTDIDSLVKVNDLSGAYKFNLPPLAKHIPGHMPGRFMVISARPECGKTAAWVTLTFAPDGFLEQGLRVACFCNEELAKYTMMRGVSAWTGLTFDQIRDNKDHAKREFDKIKGNLRMYDAADYSLEAMDQYVKKNEPHIVIVDQLDKVSVEGSFARDDQKLRQIYTDARRIGSRYGCAFIAISQLSAEAEGRRIVSHSQAENSRTGKAAEADLFIAIGKNPPSDTDLDDDGVRFWNVTKNKLNGYHGTITCMIRPEVSRYEG